MGRAIIAKNEILGLCHDVPKMIENNVPHKQVIAMMEKKLARLKNPTAWHSVHWWDAKNRLCPTQQTTDIKLLLANDGEVVDLVE